MLQQNGTNPPVKMSDKTNIEWCDSTVNPTSGCDGCELWNGDKRTCYAGELQETRLSKAFPDKYASEFSEVRLLPGRMAKAAHLPDLTGMSREGKPWLDGKPRHIFIGDLGDILSKDVSFEYLRDEVIHHVANDAGRRHIWMMLSKRPSRMVKFAEWLSKHQVSWPSNLVAMTTITGHGTAMSRIRSLCHMMDFNARIVVSAEPLLGPVRLKDLDDAAYLDGVIAGLESGPRAAEAEIDWLHCLVSDCRDLHLRVFVKQLGSNARVAGQPLRLKHKKGGDMSEWPEELRVRDFPATHPVGTPFDLD